MSVSYINYDKLRTDYNEQILPLIEEILRRGGQVSIGALLTVDELIELDKQSSDGYSRFHNAISLDDMHNKAIDNIDVNVSTKGLTNETKGLLQSYRRQRTQIKVVMPKERLESADPILRWFAMLEKFKLYTYPELLTQDREIVKHHVDYIYKYGPKSWYTPSVGLNNVESYSRSVSTQAKDYVRELADAIIYCQKLIGINQDTVGKLSPVSGEEADIKARDNNSRPGGGFPTFSSGKTPEARELNLSLAKEYYEDPYSHGIIPYLGQQRVQQSGSAVRSVLVELFPDIDWDIIVPEFEHIEAALSLIVRRYGYFIWLAKVRQDVHNLTIEERLPDSKDERKQLLYRGGGDQVLKKNLDGTGRYNYYYLSPNIFFDVEASVKPDKSLHPLVIYENVNKNRVVFAGSLPKARADQRFYQAGYTHVKQVKLDGVPGTPVWSNELTLDGVKSNMIDFIRENDEYSFTFNDKSGFDTYIDTLFKFLGVPCFIAPLFGDSHHHYLKGSSASSIHVKLLTYNGIYEFTNIIASGSPDTGSSGSMVSKVTALVANAVLSKAEVASISNIYAVAMGQPLDLGDDTMAIIPTSFIEGVYNAY